MCRQACERTTHLACPRPLGIVAARAAARGVFSHPGGRRAAPSRLVAEVFAGRFLVAREFAFTGYSVAFSK
ncbi:hypothetical protein BHQ18_16430 [Mycolicibacterium flavescens]|uniref:Uncharacterized protein n=1 Tax=Mycolicibacterium flavescens TaxID=1776 RepID=A0A1E3RH34_MYCFV|nr:hypothetical protein BHQ18_16430 [Mycolicibacterium flavescens]